MPPHSRQESRCNDIRVVGAMISDPPAPAVEECANKINTNLGDPVSYPGMNEAIKSIISRVSREALGKEYPGWVTSGATESNLLALYYWRERGKNKLILLESAHYSVLKAAKILGLKYHVIPLKPSSCAPARKLTEVVDHKSIVVATIGTTELGCIDDVRGMAEIAEKVGAAIHVDAAFLGPIMRYIVPPVMIELNDTVATLALDMHKIPEAPLPLGVLLASDQTIIESLYTQSSYIPSGRQFGILGSRPGCPVYAALRSIETLEKMFGSFEGIAEALNREAERITRELGKCGYRRISPPGRPILCLQHPNIDKIFKKASQMGIQLYKCTAPKGVRLVVMPHHIYNRETDCILELLSRFASVSD
ncbi:MAG: aminotransferase class V-fold PLP-dependent enzyme [Desulfurococcales archaeon]|nr:aminotransferase class V-fold PLP-dependent enzyme [Desulfurococcales archaeon]